MVSGVTSASITRIGVSSASGLPAGRFTGHADRRTKCADRTFDEGALSLNVVRITAGGDAEMRRARIGPERCLRLQITMTPRGGRLEIQLI
jgi:hypothetical protein